MWINLLERVYLYRVCFFTGVYGSGKTLGAVALAYQLLQENSNLKLISNLPIPFATDIRSLDSLESVVILLDEGRRYLDARRWKDRDFNIDYLRHLRSFLLISAAFDVDTRLRRLTVKRLFPLSRLPFWLYGVVTDTDPNPILALLLGPQAFFGTYPKRFVMTEKEDLFYVLIEQFFSQLAYIPPPVSEEDKLFVRNLVTSTVRSLRSL